MVWFKVDDKLHDHRKARKAGKAAMGMWVLAGSWSSDNLTDGFIPEDVALRWGTRADAERLVAAELWQASSRDGEPGWQFHDWARFQPSAAVTAAVRAKEAEAGMRGNHKRWHSDRGIIDPNCEFCYRVPDQEPDGVTRSEPESGGESGANRPVPVPDPDVGTYVPTSRRDDVERICEHLADAIEGNGSKRPAITTKWRDAARLMLDRDKRTEAEVIAAINWCQGDDFWRGNVMSMPKLREKYDQMRLQAQRRQRPTSGQSAKSDILARQRERMEELQARIEGESA